jgi:hypothetical protein
MPPEIAARPELPPQPLGDRSQSHIPLWLPALWVLGLILLLTDTGLTLLKENPLFWRNAGGYPVELRQAVLIFYYPLLGISGLGCAIYSVLAARSQAVLGHSSRWVIAGTVLLWALLFLNVGLLTANNLQNVLNGRPVHYHPALGRP